MKAIILAGEGKDKNSFDHNKATIPIKGIPMIQYVVNCIKSSEYIDSLLVVGNPQHLEPIIGGEVEIIIQQKASMMDNLLEALSYVKEEDKVLIATCDIPLIHKAVVNNFIETAMTKEADLCYPIVEKSFCEGCYPDARRTYVPLKEGVYTGGNMILLAPKTIDKIEVIARLLIRHRKNPIKMSQALGFRFILKLLLKKLSIPKLERHIQKKFKIKVKAIISQNPEIANDIDTIEDIKILEKYL
ncbi:MobA-like NTP transferase domain-containing protein [Natronincola peptidivorans]|uniref:MobA-like NTP transferase domain-containing protein n=1 Tax=Natronincola peptidivorans TaxID=426128 RepID=A0A1I0AL74_9FIRM|nr:nucleotidyltransferase family protein [Natronincola peptidivorans]SES94621.1 MobA-like NTP transferase domain-containing protein [Natronincola peptidivorans]